MNGAFPAARYGGVKKEGRNGQVETSCRLAPSESNLTPCRQVAWQNSNPVTHLEIVSYIIFEVAALGSPNLLKNLRTQDAKVWFD